MGNLASRILERLVKSEFGFVNRRESLHILNQVAKLVTCGPDVIDSIVGRLQGLH